MHRRILIIASALAVAGAGVSVAACSSHSSGGPGETGDSGTNKGDTGSGASEAGAATDTGTTPGDTGTTLADSGPSPGVDGGKDSGSGSDAGTCSPSGMFQCPPPSAGCLSVEAGGAGFVMCSSGQICVTTDECDLSAQGAGCVDIPAACSPCATAEATLANMGCPQGWTLNTTFTSGTPATGCTVDCN